MVGMVKINIGFGFVEDVVGGNAGQTGLQAYKFRFNAGTGKASLHLAGPLAFYFFSRFHCKGKGKIKLKPNRVTNCI